MHSRYRRHRLVGLGIIIIAYLVIGVLFEYDWVLTYLGSIENTIVLVAIFGCLYLVRPALALPPTILTLGAVFYIGVPGIVLAHVGTVVTAVPAYVLGLLSAEPAHEVTERLDAAVREFGTFRGMLVLTLSPLPLDLVGFGAGVSRIGPYQFLLGLFIGAIPWSIGYGIVGLSMANIESGLESTLWIVLACAGLGIVLLVPLVYRRLEPFDSAV